MCHCCYSEPEQLFVKVPSQCKMLSRLNQPFWTLNFSSVWCNCLALLALPKSQSLHQFVVVHRKVETELLFSCAVSKFLWTGKNKACCIEYKPHSCKYYPWCLTWRTITRRVLTYWIIELIPHLVANCTNMHCLINGVRALRLKWVDNIIINKAKEQEATCRHRAIVV